MFLFVEGEYLSEEEPAFSTPINEAGESVAIDCVLAQNR